MTSVGFQSPKTDGVETQEKDEINEPKSSYTGKGKEKVRKRLGELKIKNDRTSKKTTSTSEDDYAQDETVLNVRFEDDTKKVKIHLF